MARSSRVQKRGTARTKRFSGKTKAATAGEHKWALLKVNENMRLHADTLPVTRCTGYCSKDVTVEVLFDSASGVTWVSNEALQIINHRLLRTGTKSNPSATIAGFGKVDIENFTKLSLGFKNKSGGYFNVEIDAVVIDKVNGNVVGIGVDTMMEQGITISPRSGEVSFEDAGVVITKSPRFKHIHLAYEVIERERVVIPEQGQLSGPTSKANEDLEDDMECLEEEVAEVETQLDVGELLEEETQPDGEEPIH